MEGQLRYPAEKKPTAGHASHQLSPPEGGSEFGPIMTLTSANRHPARPIPTTWPRICRRVPAHPSVDGETGDLALLSGSLGELRPVGVQQGTLSGPIPHTPSPRRSCHLAALDDHRRPVDGLAEVHILFQHGAKGFEPHIPCDLRRREQSNTFIA
jgi:hypothetical protein